MHTEDQLVKIKNEYIKLIDIIEISLHKNVLSKLFEPDFDLVDLSILDIIIDKDEEDFRDMLSSFLYWNGIEKDKSDIFKIILPFFISVKKILE